MLTSSRCFSERIIFFCGSFHWQSLTRSTWRFKKSLFLCGHHVAMATRRCVLPLNRGAANSSQRKACRKLGNHVNPMQWEDIVWSHGVLCCAVTSDGEVLVRVEQSGLARYRKHWWWPSLRDSTRTDTADKKLLSLCTPRKILCLFLFFSHLFDKIFIIMLFWFIFFPRFSRRTFFFAVGNRSTVSL